MKTYVGIVDALGLESFIEVDERQERKMKRELTFLGLRAKFNSQRNAVAYKIRLSEETIEVVNDLVEEGQFIKAGKIITRYLDKINGSELTKINEHLQIVRRLRGYL